ncbi:MAG: hypothetical protein U0525_03860 [Patescibacteria group bacterium]
MSEQITERYVVSLDYPYINIDHGKSVGKKVGSVNFECEFEGPKAFCPLEHLKGESVGRIFDTVKISLESEPSPTGVIVYEGNLYSSTYSAALDFMEGSSPCATCPLNTQPKYVLPNL